MADDDIKHTVSIDSERKAKLEEMLWAMNEDKDGQEDGYVPAQRRMAKRHLQPDDGEALDPDFEHICRATVGVQAQQMVVDTMVNSKLINRQGALASESVLRTSPQRLANFFKGEGQVYAQYHLGQASYSGGNIPPPWQACRSKTTGKTYYYNPDTGKTQWDPPLYPLHPDYRIEKSPQSGALFYVHKETGQWQWDRPIDPDFVDLQKTGSVSDVKALELWNFNRGGTGDPQFAGLDTFATRRQRALMNGSSSVPRLPALKN